MRASEKISIIVPVYNVEKYLDRCINSIFKPFSRTEWSIGGERKAKKIDKWKKLDKMKGVKPKKGAHRYEGYRH